MNIKNVVIAAIVSLTLIGALVFAPFGANPTKVGSNEVAKVPTISADVPHIVELPFLYSQKSKDNEPYLTSNVQKDQVAKQVSPKTSLTQERQSQVAKVASTPQEKKVQVGDGVKTYDNVPLSKSLQTRIIKFAKSQGVSPTLVFAVMLQEQGGAKPNFTAVSPTRDHGLMQINRSNFTWLSKDLKEDYNITFNWKDPYDSAVAAIHYINLCEESWDSKGLSQKELKNHTIISYNMGVRNASKYLKRHKATDWKYVSNVLSYEKRIEKGEQIVKSRGNAA